MSTNSSRAEDTASRVASGIPVTTFFQLNETSQVPSEYRSPAAFTITRLRSPAGLPDRITKTSPIPALLLSVSLQGVARSNYQLWAADKLLPTPIVHPFRCNLIDFDARPRCWAGSAFDYVHYSIPREGLGDIAEDLGFGAVNDFRLAVLEDDLVVAQITRSTLPFVGRTDESSMLALDQLRLILGAHLVQRYGAIRKKARVGKGGLAPWQKRRACELLREKLHGRIRLTELARECGLSESHFARSFKLSFGISAHQWLIRQRMEFAKDLINGTDRTLMEIAVQSGFSDQAAFTRAFQQVVGATPGSWRRQHLAGNPRP